ncbi:hypothetical protein FRC01_008195 [Tulasnella sp. 417]|nr:hypothetical protein FRC01_008195 [Tulasnella sp. 417]
MLLDIFHTQATFWMDGLQDLIILHDATSGVSKATQKQPATNSGSKKDLATVPLYPSHLTGLQLSSLSDIDSRFVELLAQARFNRTAVVKRGWKDMVAAILAPRSVTLVYDVTRPKSLENLRQWVDKLNLYVDPCPPMIVVGKPQSTEA